MAYNYLQYKNELCVYLIGVKTIQLILPNLVYAHIHIYHVTYSCYLSTFKPAQKFTHKVTCM